MSMLKLDIFKAKDDKIRVSLIHKFKSTTFSKSVVIDDLFP